MKKQILSSLGVVALLLAGCGGGSGSVDVNVSAIIVDKPFYRVITADDRYLKEIFDNNGTLNEETYFMDNSFDSNRTIPYEIKNNLVYITDNNQTIKCSVKDSNLSVTFLCLEEEDQSGSGIPTIRWKTLADAILNPES